MANLTIGDIYIAVNKVLENYETQIEGKPTLRTTEIRVITDERFEAKESIEAELKKLGITPGPPTGGKAKSSSFEGSEIGPFGNDKEKIRFVYKNRTNKGSGGGANPGTGGPGSNNATGYGNGGGGRRVFNGVSGSGSAGIVIIKVRTSE